MESIEQGIKSISPVSVDTLAPNLHSRPAVRRAGADSVYRELTADNVLSRINELISVKDDERDSSYITLDNFIDYTVIPSFRLLDTDVENIGRAVGHSQYKYQKRLLALLMNFNDLSVDDVKLLLDDENFNELHLHVPDTTEYHEILSSNPRIVSDNLLLWVEALRFVLEEVERTYIHIPIRAIYDAETNYAFLNSHYLAHPVTQFNSGYKMKKLKLILKFKLATKLLSKKKLTSPFSVRKSNHVEVEKLLSNVDCEQFPILCQALRSKMSFNFDFKVDLSSPALFKLAEILERPLLFVTITMGRDEPVETFIKYKKSWNNFFTQMKKLMRSLGWGTKYYVKGVETTKSGRLHVHLVFLGVSPSHPSQLVDFKFGLEKALRNVGFGYVNDVELISQDYNLVVISQSDLMKPEKGFFDENGNKLRDFKVLRTFELPYEKGTATFLLLKVNPAKKTQNWERVVNYVFKYPLKGETFEDVKNDDEKLQIWLRSNVLFWIFGIKRWWISKELSKLLNEAFPTERRFYFFKNEFDMLVYLKHPDVYDILRKNQKFEVFLADAVSVSDIRRNATLSLFYGEHGLLDLSDDYSDVLDNIHFEYVVTPDTLSRLIDNDSFKLLIEFRYSKIIRNVHDVGGDGDG